ncbi:MAG TPA: molecular chaperone TorD family protein [Anaerolineales bacterium]|nr:molecular chaperone TorD family protein [Anaerolineales bacterium]
MSFSLLSHLWLHEPDADAIARAVTELGLPPAEPAELASAHADVFLLNVYPYGTTFTDPSGELNGPDAQRIAALYETRGYCPPELNAVGAPDHLGLCLGFLAHLSDTKCLQDTSCLLLEWAPICCLAVEREPSAHSFYRALALRTRDRLMAEISNPKPQTPKLQNPQSEIYSLQFEEEVSLRDIARFFLAPAKCGMFLSRSRLGQMAKESGMRLPFGSRFDVAEMLFASAGEAGQIESLIDALKSEVEAWATEYRAWAEKHPAWRPFAEAWLARTADSTRTLAEMKRIVETERT